MLGWQDNICNSLTSLDASTEFVVDNWQSKLGSGKTIVLGSSRQFESAGVNFSYVSSKSLPEAALPGRSELAGKPYIATGVSTVIHPRNPYVPTSHANLRFFIVDPESENPCWWFGGCFDLTPYYPYLEDCVLWHKYAHKACKPYGSEVYLDFKEQCDNYFFLPHRDEPRGIGGLFFDNLNRWGFARTSAFTNAVAAAYLGAYTDIVAKRCDTPYGERERNFQLYRRGRYVEFNLLHDRGTKFGIESRGRTESILMSLPPVANWQYNWQPEEGSPESELYTRFLVKRDWLNLENQVAV